MRLKKGPDIADYAVEVILANGGRAYSYFNLRAEARENAKKENARGYRTRIFRIKYTLVADSKPAKGKGKR